MRVVRVAFLGLLAVANMATIGNGCGPSLPANDTCSTPSSGNVSSLRFVSTSGSGATIPDLETQGLIFGPQGGSMVELRFAINGAAVPECAGFTLTAQRCINLECSQLEEGEVFPATPALQTYEHEGEHHTRNYLFEIPFRYTDGDLILVRAQVGASSGSLRMWLEREGPLFDAGPRDAGLAADAMPGLPDALP